MFGFSGLTFTRAVLITATLTAVSLTAQAETGESVKSKLDLAHQLSIKFDYEGAIEQYKGVQAAINATETERMTASLTIIKYYLILKKFDEADSAASLFIRNNTGSYVPATMAQVKTAQLALAEAKIGKNKDDEAIAIYQEVIKNDSKGTRPWLLKMPLIGLLLRKNKYDEAVVVYGELMGSPVPTLPTETTKSFRKFAFVQAKDPSRVGGIISLCRKAMTTSVNDLRRREMLQQTIAEMYLAREEYDKAIMEAKILMQASESKEGMEAALNVIMMSFKVKDGNLSRVNQLIQFQKTGRAGVDKKLGTEDDIENPLAAVNIRYSEADNRLFEVALAKASRDWSGRLERANLYLFWAKPKEALVELKTAFAVAPLEQATIQKITDRILVALVEAGGDPTLSDEYIRFQRSGPGEAKPADGGADHVTNPIDLVLNSK